MSEFRNLLLSTLEGVNNEFNEALSDLKTVVAELNDAVKAVSNDLRVFLVSRDKRLEGTIYVLILAREKLTSQAVGYYMVYAKGYPVTYGSSLSYSGSPAPPRELNSKQELEEHFREMLQNKNSPLVVQLAYLMRK